MHNDVNYGNASSLAPVGDEAEEAGADTTHVRLDCIVPGAPAAEARPVSALVAGLMAAGTLGLSALGGVAALAGCNNSLLLIASGTAASSNTLKASAIGVPLAVGEERELSGLMRASDGQLWTQPLSWSSSNTKVAEFTASTGRLKAHAPGSVLVTATSTSDPSIRASIEVTVVGAMPSTGPQSSPVPLGSAAPVATPGKSPIPTTSSYPSAIPSGRGTPPPSVAPSPSPKPRIFRQASGSRFPLRAVQFLDNLTGYAVGDGKVVLKTTDGETWKALGSDQFLTPDGREHNIQDLSFVDAKTGWVVSDRAVFATGDGGATWTKQLDVGGDDIRFSSAERGYMLGCCSTYVTTDGGQTWEEEAGVGPLSAISVHGDTVFGLKSGSVERLTPGLGWGKALDIGRSSYGYSTMFFASARDGWVHDSTNFFRTGDGGNSWNKLKLPPGNENYAAPMFFVNARVGWILNIGYTLNGTSLYRTVDGGSTWEQIELAPNLALSSLWFTDENNGWLAGSSGMFRYAVK